MWSQKGVGVRVAFPRSLSYTGKSMSVAGGVIDKPTTNPYVQYKIKQKELGY